MGGLPDDPEAKKAVDVLCREFGWEYRQTGPHSHPAGQLFCAEHSRDGCIINVASTGHNTARKMWQKARRCTHGCAPIYRQW